MGLRFDWLEWVVTHQFYKLGFHTVLLPNLVPLPVILNLPLLNVWFILALIFLVWYFYPTIAPLCFEFTQPNSARGNP